jgi:hypothetical protein
MTPATRRLERLEAVAARRRERRRQAVVPSRQDLTDRLMSIVGDDVMGRPRPHVAAPQETPFEVFLHAQLYDRIGLFPGLEVDAIERMILEHKGSPWTADDYLARGAAGPHRASE